MAIAETELKCCWWDGDLNRIVLAGADGCTRIVLRSDGCGLSGYYDRIHVFHEDGGHTVYPAHHVAGWEVKT